MITIGLCTIVSVAVLMLYLKARFEIRELQERKKDLEVKIDALIKYYESTININKSKR